MSGLTRCPDAEELRQFTLGRSSRAETEYLCQHLTQCDACGVRYEATQAADPLVAEVRQAAIDTPDPAHQLLVRRLIDLHLTQSEIAPDTETGIPDHSAAFRTPPTIPGYESLSELGRGGMGVVYKAKQTRLHRTVAIKVILAGGHAKPEDIARFRREATAQAQLQHPNIVQIYEIGDHDGLPYFAMELVPAVTLEKKLAGTPQPPSAAAALVEILARAMQVAHTSGVIHRDLKPANVIITNESVPKIADFGLAKSSEATALTGSNAIMGTPSYMAPEQVAGKDIESSADVYSLGAILYEMLTGRPPFKGTTPLETMAQVCNGEPVSPRRLNGQVPRDLATICLKCLERSPGQRYLSALELSEDLNRWIHDLPIRAKPPGVVAKAIKFCHREPLKAVAVTSAIALLVLAFFVYSVFRAKEQEKINAVARTEGQASQALGEATRLEEQARQSADDLGQWERLLHLALAASNQAAALLETGQASEQLHAEVLKLREQLEEQDLLRRLVVELNEGHDKFSIPGSSGQTDPLAYQDRIRRAFLHAKVEIGKQVPEVVAKRLLSCPQHQRLFGALWDWERWTKIPDDRVALNAIAMAADSDSKSVMNRWRKAKAENSKAAFKGLAEDPQTGTLHPFLLQLLEGDLRVAGLSQQGEVFMRKCLARHATNFWVNVNLADNMMQQQPPKIDEAIQYYSVGRALRPDSALVLNQLGVAFAIRGDLKRDGKDIAGANADWRFAATQFKLAVDLNPNFTTGFKNLGQTYELQESWDAAIQAYQQAIAQNPLFAHGHFLLGNALLAKHSNCPNVGLLTMAIAEFEKLKPNDPDFAQGQYGKGEAQIRMGNRAEALKTWRHVLTLLPPNQKELRELIAKRIAAP